MYFLLILFFGSLLGIIFMIGRQLMLTQNISQSFHKEQGLHRERNLEEWKDILTRNLKSYTYKSLVVTIRFYVKLSNFIKKIYSDKKTKIKEIYRRKFKGKEVSKREASKFLKMVSDYKHRIRNIQKQIKEEEGLK